MNQTDMIQRIIATEHQASALTESAKAQRDNLESSIQQEIQALRSRYEENADAYLQKLQAAEEKKRAERLSELDQRLAHKLQQVEDIYDARKDQWVEAIFQRIVGKAGD